MSLISFLGLLMSNSKEKKPALAPEVVTMMSKIDGGQTD